MFDVLDELEMAIDKVAASESPLEVEQICRLAERVEFLKVRAIRDYDRSCAWRTDGYISTAAALRTKCRMQHGVARGAVDLGRKLEDLPLVADAFGAGEISRQHAEAIGAAHTPERAGAFADVEAELVTVARLAAPGKLRDVLKGLTDALDGDGGAGSDDEIYAKRSLHSSKTMGGVRGDWFLDPEGGDIVNVALAAQMETASVPDDPRTLQQRRADALVDICRLSLASEHHPVCAPKRRRGIPHVLSVVDIRMFEAEHPVLVADIRSEFAYAGRISRATLERMACDWDISRIIIDGPSEVLDLGRSTRIPSDKQFKALVVRDQHCQAPGCKVPWQYCQPHHTVWWIQGGNTDLKNLKLLCGYHHRQEHARNPPRRE